VTALCAAIVIPELKCILSLEHAYLTEEVAGSF
jgi:hypothetical protein